MAIPMFSRLRPVFASMALAGALFLTACDSPPPQRPAQISFSRYQPIYLDVANIQVIDEYKPPLREPNVEHLIPISPTDAMHVWVKDRLRAVGMQRYMQVIIHDASVISSPLPAPEGITGYFSDVPTRKYDANLNVELRIYGEGMAMSEASITITANQSQTISQKASREERTAIFNSMIGRLMERANAELEKQAFTYFSRYIMYGQTP